MKILGFIIMLFVMSFIMSALEGNVFLYLLVGIPCVVLVIGCLASGETADNSYKGNIEYYEDDEDY